ncbi:ATP-dependent DNA ligase Cdc17 [Hypoxylon texense]
MRQGRIPDRAKGKQKASGSSPVSSTTTATTVTTNVGSIVSGDLHPNSLPRDFRSYTRPSARSDPRALLQSFIYALGRAQSLLKEARVKAAEAEAAEAEAAEAEAEAAEVEAAIKEQLALAPPPPSPPPPPPPLDLQPNADPDDLDPIPGLEPDDHDHDHDHDGEGEGEGEGEFAEEEMYPTVPCPCPCPCHENSERREGRPWLPFGNAAYVACPVCWVDAYMHANGDGGGGECDRYLRGRGKDPNMPAAVQC